MKYRPVIGRMFNIAICEALGLELKRIRSISINVANDEAATVVIEQYIDEDQAAELYTIMEKYEALPATEIPREKRMQ